MFLFTIEMINSHNIWLSDNMEISIFDEEYNGPLSIVLANQLSKISASFYVCGRILIATARKWNDCYVPKNRHNLFLCSSQEYFFFK